MEQPKEWSVGTHHVRFESPDILWASLRGWITEEDARRLVEIGREMGSREPVYWVVHMEAMEGFPFPRLSVEGRKYLARHSCSDWFRAILHVGGDLPQKITIKGLTLALLLTGKTLFETAFPADRGAARAWIEEHRKRPRRKGTR